ncbi:MULTISPECIES: SDR family oxidoreductase [Ramlibacter]|uniref:SDR family oxidoreductase n=1 Tax=Ramlibacter pinisoli TaxID=2682844 RepID=A0A6N8ISZ6_9BURK|nr:MULTISPECIES: SDR family oxidoreductase [Ramlibacter]MBA2965019.1 SDR family oxidoreductase [Ramlibacter sp. CGMCC 1.13660]MVQ29984.1 SDR family oxidoreductase [Ramlibacter pinisoli]
MNARRVVVTGGAGGIGRAIALRFAQGGCDLHLLGRDAGRLKSATDEIVGVTGRVVTSAICDLGDGESLRDAFADQRIDVLVNAAGSITRKPLLDTQPADWRGAWSDKVLGAIEATRLACERMRASGGGVIVNIMGTAGVRLNPKTIMTSTANAALIAFTQAAGSQSVDWNVRIAGINPGLTATPRTQDLAAGRGGDSYKAMLADMPFGRMAYAGEIADCAWFLASPQAAYISGTVIDVDAGARWRA